MPEQPPDACLACGTPHESGQEYCLECGARLLKPRGPVHTLGRAWRRRLPWYPGDWIWPSLLALLVAAAGAAAAIFATGGAKGSTPETLVATTRLAPVPPTTAAPPPPTTTATTATTPTTPTKAKPRTLIRWPGQNAYTVILASEPLRGGREAARTKANRALELGLPDVGVLVSTRYSSLHPGYYVVFSGVFASYPEAQEAARKASRRFPSAYARQITR